MPSCLVQYPCLGRLVTAVTAGLLKVIVVVVMSDFRWGLRTKVWYTLNFHVLVAFWIGALSGDGKVVSRGRVVFVWYCGLMGQLQWMEEPMRFTGNFTARNYTLHLFYIKNTVYECHVAYNNIVEGFSIVKVLKVKMGKNPNYFLHLLFLNSFLASNIVFVAKNALQITV